MLTQNELIAISAWSRAQLHSVLSGHSLDDALKMRRNLQQALTEYARKNKYDIVQESILGIIMQIERWARRAYVYKRLPGILSSDWSYLKKGKYSAKAKANEEFDRILRDTQF